MSYSAHELRKACQCLYLAVDAEIADEVKQRAEAVLADLAGSQRDTERLEWWFARGMDDSVCEGSVDLWWATEINGAATTVVTHGTSLRDALDMAMNGIFESEDRP